MYMYQIDFFTRSAYIFSSNRESFLGSLGRGAMGDVWRAVVLNNNLCRRMSDKPDTR